jgi:hypothetical protein
MAGSRGGSEFQESGGRVPSDSENEDEIFRVLQEVQGSVNPSAANALTISRGVRVEANGWITIAQAFVAQVQIVAGSEAPHGRFFMELSVLQNQRSQFDKKQIAAILWRGYEGPASIPNVYVSEGAYIFLRVWAGTNASLQDNLSFYCQVSNRPVGGANIFNELPGTGPGEMIFAVLAAPAAGADYAPQVVPAGVRQRVRAWDGNLTTAVAAANRQAATERDTGAAANTYAVDTVGGAIPASSIVDVGQSITSGQPYTNFGAISGGTNANSPLSDIAAPATHRFVWQTANLQAADQWSAGEIMIEEWAVPA